MNYEGKKEGRFLAIWYALLFLICTPFILLSHFVIFQS